MLLVDSCKGLPMYGPVASLLASSIPQRSNGSERLVVRKLSTKLTLLLTTTYFLQATLEEMVEVSHFKTLLLNAFLCFAVKAWRSVTICVKIKSLVSYDEVFFFLCCLCMTHREDGRYMNKGVKKKEAFASKTKRHVQ